VAAPLILARTFKDAHAYARDVLGLSIGYYRVVNSPGTIKAVRGTEIHLVEGWDKRPDRFSMKTAMRYCRNRIVDTTAQEPAPVDPRGDLTERQLEVAHRYNRLLDLDPETPKLDALMAETTIFRSDEAVPDSLGIVGGLPETDFFDEPEVAEEKPTCIDCGLDIHADDCPKYVALVAEGDTHAEKPKARRRSKCKACGSLHFKDEPCPDNWGV
jgi:hypothetical protein